MIILGDGSYAARALRCEIAVEADCDELYWGVSSVTHLNGDRSRGSRHGKSKKVRCQLSLRIADILLVLVGQLVVRTNLVVLVGYLRLGLDHSNG